eukprot:8456719-Ditylum_brightwellii.AAC.1
MDMGSEGLWKGCHCRVPCLDSSSGLPGASGPTEPTSPLTLPSCSLFDYRGGSDKLMKFGQIPYRIRWIRERLSLRRKED